MDRFKRIVLAMAAQLLAFGVQAQVHSFETYGRELARSESITALPAGFGQFGERIDFYSGAVSFHKTVVELPGNNALRVAADYEYTVQEKLGWPPKYALRRAEPFIMGIHSTELGWMVGSPNAYTGRRCSDPRRRGVAEVVRSSKPPIDNFLPEDYWDGNSLVGTEGGGIIRRLDQGEPSIPNVDVRWATNGGWRFSCYQLADGSDGFVGHGPDGNRYYFGRPERDEETLQIMSNFQQSDTWLDVSLYRMRLTRVEDRFGNWVNYSSSQITASDGRSITFSGTDGSVIEAGGRQWRLQGGVLTNPDGSTWSIGSVGGIAARPDGGAIALCGSLSQIPMAFSGQLTVNVKLESNVSASFALEPRRRGYSQVTSYCLQSPTGGKFSELPHYVDGISLVSRSMQGAGVPLLTHSIDYGPPNACYQPAVGQGLAEVCTSSSPVTRTTAVTGPDGTVERYVFGNRARMDAGLLLSHSIGSSQVVSYEYALPYENAYDMGKRRLYDVGQTSITVLTRSLIRRDGVNFERRVPSDCGPGANALCIDTFYRPVKFVSSSAAVP
ncbi:TPA: hypothetical protein QEK88_001460 [Stenotrophomonas maltophilia]|nr:hypothetical protein [Stenotrophomonas maltophilia]